MMAEAHSEVASFCDPDNADCASYSPA